MGKITINDEHDFLIISNNDGDAKGAGRITNAQSLILMIYAAVNLAEAVAAKNKDEKFAEVMRGIKTRLTEAFNVDVTEDIRLSETEGDVDLDVEKSPFYFHGDPSIKN